MKKTLSLLILIGGILLLAGCGQKVDNNSINNTINSDKQIQESVQDCFSSCDILTKTKEEREDCYKLCETSKKLESNNINDCEDIDKSSGGFITRDICIQDKAIKNKNPDFCEMIEVSIHKDACYMSLAEELENKELCNKISNEIIQSACLEEAKK